MKKGTQTKQTITQEAIAVASQLGLGNLTIGNLAKAVGMSKSGLFAHFSSKEALQLHILQSAREQFIQQAILPSLKTPRGEPRIRALFTHWLKWVHSEAMPGGCVFLAAVPEFDDQPGPIRDFLVYNQKDWFEFIVGAARIAMEEGHFRKDLDVRQFAYEVFSIFLGYTHISRLLRDPQADERLTQAFEALLTRSQPIPTKNQLKNKGKNKPNHSPVKKGLRQQP